MGRVYDIMAVDQGDMRRAPRCPPVDSQKEKSLMEGLRAHCVLDVLGLMRFRTASEASGSQRVEIRAHLSIPLLSLLQECFEACLLDLRYHLTRTITLPTILPE